MLAHKDFGGFDTEIRKLYKQSGLYINDGSSTPLWTIDWYAFKVFPSSDGIHLIRMGPWASSTDDLSLAFYKNGEEIKKYNVRNLVRDNSKLEHTVSHFFWRSELKYDDEKLLVYLKTKDNQAYTFSIKTGEIIHKNIQQKN